MLKAKDQGQGQQHCLRPSNIKVIFQRPSCGSPIAVASGFIAGTAPVVYGAVITDEWSRHSVDCRVYTILVSFGVCFWVTFSFADTKVFNFILLLIIIATTMFMVLSSWPKSLQEFTRFIWWMYTERRVAANPQTKPTNLGCESAENWQLSSRSTIDIVISTQPISWYSFYRPTEGGRLSRPNHCSGSAQPVPKAAYRISCCNKRNRPRRDSNLGPLTPQSGVLTTRPLIVSRCIQISFDFKAPTNKLLWRVCQQWHLLPSIEDQRQTDHINMSACWTASLLLALATSHASLR